MPKRHSRSDSWVLHGRYIKRVCVTVDSHLRVRLGLPPRPELAGPYPVDLNQVVDLLEKIANKELGADGS